MKIQSGKSTRDNSLKIDEPANDFADYFESDAPFQDDGRAEALYNDALITLRDGDVKPTPALQIVCRDRTPTVAFFKACILIFGAEKAGKGRLYIIIAAAFLSGEFGPFKCARHKRKVLILHSDDQRHALFQLAREISVLAGKSTGIHDQLVVLGIRTLDVLEKKLVLEEAIKRHQDLGIVIIDLAWDWVDSVNNEVYTKILMDELLKFADENDFLLILITHQSRVDRAPKGHQGAQFASKAQTVFHVKKKKDAFIVTAVQTRGPHIEPFAFKYDGASYEFVEIAELSKKSGAAKGDFSKTDDGVHLGILNQMPNTFRTSDELRTKLAEVYGAVVEPIGINLRKALVNYYVKKGWIRKEGRSMFFRNGTAHA